MRRTRILVHVLLLILGVWSAQIVHANPTYQISLLGGRWDGHRIKVQVPAQPAWARDLVLEAMTTWNQAQVWFLQSYEKQEAIRYDLVESVNGSVQIELVDFTGVTAIREAKPAKDGTRFTNATMFLPLSFRGYPVRSDWFETIALHEFGHVLGLDHTDMTTDLMSTSLNVGALPSTLDLSGVQTLALGSTPSLVTLNSSIPYQEVPTSSVPEFPANGWFVLGVSILLCAGLGLVAAGPTSREILARNLGDQRDRLRLHPFQKSPDRPRNRNANHERNQLIQAGKDHKQQEIQANACH